MYNFQGYLIGKTLKKSRLRRVMWYIIVGKTQEKMVTAARYVLFSGVKCRQNVKKIRLRRRLYYFQAYLIASYRYHIISYRACILCYYFPHLP